MKNQDGKLDKWGFRFFAAVMIIGPIIIIAIFAKWYVENVDAATTGGAAATVNDGLIAAEVVVDELNQRAAPRRSAKRVGKVLRKPATVLVVCAIRGADGAFWFRRRGKSPRYLWPGGLMWVTPVPVCASGSTVAGGAAVVRMSPTG